MRIIGGSLRGKKLKIPLSSSTRPTMDRHRESCINMLTSLCSLTAVRALDAFAGTGAMGLEFLSRGAAHVTFVEHDPWALKILKENIAACRMTDQSTIVPQDILKMEPAAAPFDLIFLDPPYRETSLATDAIQHLKAQGYGDSNTLWVLESSPTHPPLLPSKITILKQRVYRQTQFTFMSL